MEIVIAIQKVLNKTRARDYSGSDHPSLSSEKDAQE